LAFPPKKDFRPDLDKNPFLEDKKTIDFIIVVSSFPREMAEISFAGSYSWVYDFSIFRRLW
jgi:hypothetical protein